jgi:hypothetical protein
VAFIVLSRLSGNKSIFEASKYQGKAQLSLAWLMPFIKTTARLKATPIKHQRLGIVSDAGKRGEPWMRIARRSKKCWTFTGKGNLRIRKRPMWNTTCCIALSAYSF